MCYNWESPVFAYYIFSLKLQGCYLVSILSKSLLVTIFLQIKLKSYHLQKVLVSILKYVGQL